MTGAAPIACFRRRGRRPLTLGLVLALWGALALAVRVIDMALFWAVGLGLFALPAVLDCITDRPVWLAIYPDRIAWKTGRRNDAMPAREIARLRLDRRLDTGFRLTIIDTNGRVHGLPPELPAPADALTAALDRAGIAHERHPFSLRPG